MSKVYIVSLLAREIQSIHRGIPVFGDLVHQMIELVTSNEEKAKQYVENAVKQTIIMVDNVQCFAERGIFESELED